MNIDYWLAQLRWTWAYADLAHFRQDVAETAVDIFIFSAVATNKKFLFLSSRSNLYIAQPPHLPVLAEVAMVRASPRYHTLAYSKQLW